MNGQTALTLAKAWRRNEIITTLEAATKRTLESPPTSLEAFFEVETMGTPAHTTQFSWADDEVSTPKRDISSGAEAGRGLAYKARKVEEHKWSWWRFLLLPKARYQHY